MDRRAAAHHQQDVAVRAIADAGHRGRAFAVHVDGHLFGPIVFDFHTLGLGDEYRFGTPFSSRRLVVLSLTMTRPLMSTSR
jgi:hypothetical protein